MNGKRSNVPRVGGGDGNRRDVGEPVRAEEKIRFQARLLEAVGQAVIATDREGEVLYWNRYAECLYGWSAKEALGRNIREMVIPEGSSERVAEIMEELRAGRSWSGELELMRRDGTIFPAMVTDTPVYDERGALVSIICVCSDITESKRVEEALKESEQRFRASFEDAAIGMALVDTRGYWSEVNGTLCEILGYSEEELRGKTFREVTHPDDLWRDLGNFHRLLAGEVRTYQVEKRYLHKEGHVVWALLSTSLVHDKDGEPLYFVSQIQDISKRKRVEERLQHWALHDPLTGLPNRRLFKDRLGRALERTRRRRERSVAVLFMDLDGFKIMNDSLGHDSGDLLLTVVAQRLQRSLRSADTLGRFGGDEFVVVMEDVESPDDAVRVAEKITAQLRHPFVVDGRSLSIAVSIGIAIGDARTSSPGSLLRDADTAMYRAKDYGSDYVVFDPGMHLRAVERLKLEDELRRAVERREFVVHYQPIVNLDNGEVWGLEALLRWDHSERGLLNPDEFIPVADECGLAEHIGEHVLEDACRRAKEWQEEHPLDPPLVLTVNLSAKQLARFDLAETVEAALGRTGLEGSRLSLEVTEAAYVEALEAGGASLDRIRDMGVRIMIDDFGTGFSSLSYLKRLPADALKIDRGFVAGLGDCAKDTAIGRMVIELAHTLGMEVVAEGVERWSQAALLAEMGCDFAQGYHFAEPLPPEEVPDLLRQSLASHRR